MSNYIITKDGLQDVNSLQHWKYVKREKVNGKWRYYYSDEEYQNAKKKYNTAKKEFDEVSSAKKELDKVVSDKKKQYESDGDISLEEHVNLSIMSSVQEEVHTAYAKKGMKFIESNEKFKKIKMKTLPRRLVAKAAATVANFFSKNFSKKKRP